MAYQPFRWFARAMIICVAVLSFSGFLLGFITERVVEIPVSGNTWYAIDTTNGMLVLIERSMSTQAGGKILLYTGHKVPVDWKGRLDVTAPIDSSLGPA